MKPEPGFYPGTNYATYASWEAMRSSVLRLFARSPLHAYAAIVSPEGDRPTTPKEVGEVTHCAILEPNEVEKRYVVWSGPSRATKVGKAEWADFVLRNRGKKIIDQKEMDEALRIRDAVWKQPWAEALLASAGLTEVSYCWVDRMSGVLCKVRPDRFVADFDGYPTLVDIKTAVDASPEGFERAERRFRYRVQASMQLDGLEALQPHPTQYLWVVPEKGPVYAPALYSPTEELLKKGREQYGAALMQYIECSRSGIWPGYSPRPRLIDLAPWEKNRASASLDDFEGAEPEEGEAPGDFKLAGNHNDEEEPF